MSRLALLLRGINVGGKNKVAMADLRTLLADLGYADAKTLLNSGNAVVTTTDAPDAAERRVEDALEKRYGKRIDVLARTRDELAAAIDANPLRDIAHEPKYYAVAFLRSAPPPDALDKLDPTDYEPDRWQLVGRELFIWYANGQANTKIGAPFFRALAVPATARNWNTVLKLRDLTG